MTTHTHTHVLSLAPKWTTYLTFIKLTSESIQNSFIFPLLLSLPLSARSFFISNIFLLAFKIRLNRILEIALEFTSAICKRLPKKFNFLSILNEIFYFLKISSYIRLHERETFRVIIAKLLVHHHLSPTTTIKTNIHSTFCSPTIQFSLKFDFNLRYDERWMNVCESILMAFKKMIKNLMLLLEYYAMTRVNNFFSMH